MSTAWRFLRDPITELRRSVQCISTPVVLAGGEETPIGSCFDSSILSNFVSNLSDAVNPSALQAYLEPFELDRGNGDDNAVFDFRSLGQTLANVTDAIQWPENKPYADQALERVNTYSSSMFNSLAEMVLSINFAQVAQTLESAGMYSSGNPVGINGDYAVQLLNALSVSVNTTRLGAAIQSVSSNVRLQDLGSDLDSVKGNLKLDQLVGVLAKLPDAVDFFAAGQLLSNMAASFKFADIGGTLDNFVTSAGGSLESCNSA